MPATLDLRRGQVLGDASRRAVNLNTVTHDVAAATYAPIASPTFTGDPKAPTPAPGDNDTSVATTAFVHTAVGGPYLPLTGGTLTGNLTVNPGTITVGTASPAAVPGTAGVQAYNQGVWSVCASGGQGAVGCYDQTTGHIGAYLFSAAGWAGVGTITATGGFSAVGMAFGAGGNVGIGISVAPVNAKLEVAGGAILQANGQWHNGWNAAGTTQLNMMGIDGSNNMLIANNVPGNCTINATGGLSVTSGAITSTGANAAVNAVDRNTSLPWSWYGASGSGRLYYNGADRMLIDGVGNLTMAGGTATKPGGGSWVAPSSVDLKSDIADYPRGLAEILQLNPVVYRYNGKGGLPTDQTFTGLTVEDVAPVMPEMVVPLTLDMRGADQLGPDPTVTSGIDTAPLIMALVNCVKELTVRIQTLEAASAR